MYISQAIEFSQSKERVPSCIEEAREGRGGLWHGGFKAVMNHQFLKTEGITHVVNTAKGLEIFGPRYTVRKWSNVEEGKVYPGFLYIIVIRGVFKKIIIAGYVVSHCDMELLFFQCKLFLK